VCGGPSKGMSVLYSTLHCLIQYGSDNIAEYSSTLSENAICNGDLDFFIIDWDSVARKTNIAILVLSNLRCSSITKQVLWFMESTLNPVPRTNQYITMRIKFSI